MDVNYTLGKQLNTQKWLTQNLFKYFFTTLILVFTGISAFGQQTCTQTFSVSGDDGDPTVLSISAADISCNFGGAISQITLNSTSNFSDGNCDSWYEFTLDVFYPSSGTSATGCGPSFNNTDITGFSSLTITSADTDSWPVDSITIEVELTVEYTPASCIPPANLIVSNLTAAAADISWDAEATATGGYDYFLTSVGTVPDGTTTPTGSLASGTLTANLTSLTADTDYDVYVRSDCGGSESAWSSAVSFFTGYCDSTPASNDGAGINQIDFNGTVLSSGGDITYEDFIATTVDIQQAVTASLDITFTTGFTYDTNIWIDYNDNLTFEASELVFDGVSTGANPTTLDASFLVDVSANLGNHRMRIGTADSGQSTPNPCYTGSFGVTIDITVNVIAAPSCLAPTNLSVSNIASTTATIAWDTEATATGGYDYFVTSAGTVPDGTTTPTGSVASGTLTANLTGLSANTDYDAYVRSDCGGGDESAWSTSAVSFTTDCAAFTTPYSQNFDGAPTSDPFAGIDCWTTAGNNANEIELEDGVFWSTTPSSPNLVEFGDVDYDIGNEAILVSPQFSDLPDADNRIRFQAAFEDASSNTNELIIGVMSDPNDATTFVELERVTSSTDDVFNTYIVNLDDAVNIGTSQYIAIASAASNGGFDEIAFDDFVYEEIPSCITPTNLAVSNIAATTATIAWDTEATATGGYDYFLTDAGTVPDGTTTPTGSVASGTLTANLTSLTDNTDYDVYVRSDCGGDGESAWSSAVSFTTLCAAISTFPSITDMTNNVPTSCWDEAGSGEVAAGPSNLGSSDWRDNRAYQNSVGATVNSNAINLFSDSDREWLLSPFYDLSTDGPYQLKVEVAVTNYSFSGTTTSTDNMGSDDEVKLLMSTDGGTNWSTLNTWNASNQPSVNGTEYIEDLTAQTGTVQFAIWASDGTNNNSEDYDFHVGVFTVEEIPSCITPTNLAVSNITTTTATISWDTEATATGGYDYFVTSAGTVPDGSTTPTGSVASGTLSANLTSLTANTDYEVYVRSDCGGGDESAWSSAVSFTTLCAAFSIPFSENFDSTVAGSASIPNAPDCWSFIDGGAGWAYVFNSSFNSQSGNNSYRLYNSSDSSGNYMLISPEITELTSDGLQVSFSVKGASGQELELGTMSDPTDATSFTVLQTVTLSSSSYEDVEANVVGGTDSYFAFRHGQTGTFDYYYIDDVSFGALPNCLVPINLAVSNLLSTSATISWDTEATATGGYDYFVTSAGTVPDGTTTPTGSVASGTLTANLTGLTADTDYDVYVRSDCGGSESTWSSAVSFFTGYCDSTPASNDGTGISQINFNGTVLSSGGDITYEDFIATTVDIQQAVTASLDITFTTGFTYDTNIWIDYNDNLTFEASELVFDGESTNANPTTLDASFLVDASATLGSHRMRIGTADGGQSTPNPCYTGTFGVTIDITVNVTAAPSCIPPTNLAVSNVTTTTATISWDTEATATGGYDYFVTSVGTVPDGSTTPTGSVASGTLTANLTSLTADTDYDVYVRSDCGGSESAWSSDVNFSTPFLASVPFTENFNAAISEWNVTGWSRGTVSFRNVEGRDGSDVLWRNLWGSATSGSFSTPLVGPIVSGNYLSFEFKSSYYSSPQGPVDAGDLEFTVDVTDSNGTTEEFSYTSNGTAGWEKVYIDLSDYVGENIDIQIDAVRNGGDFYLFFDNFKVGSIDGYVYLNDTDTWVPSTPVGNSTSTDKITIASNSSSPSLTGLTTADNLEVYANSVLSVEDVLDLDGDIFNDGQIVFKSTATKTAQLDVFSGTISGEHGSVQTERFIQAGDANNRAFRLVTSAVDAGSIYDNWQEAGASPAGFGTHITGSTTGANGLDQTLTGDESMFTFNNASPSQGGGAAWAPVLNTSGTNLSAGVPYRLFVRGDRNINLSDNGSTPNNTVLRATGSLKTGTVSAGTLAQLGGQFSFIGNPYQAIVNMNSLTVSGDVNTNYVYAWDAKAADNGAFVTVELPAGTNPSSNGNVDNFLQPGQAIFIRNNVAGFTTPGTIDFTEASKNTAATQLSPFSTTSLPKVDFQLFTASNFANNGSTSDAVGLRFDDNFSLEVNDADAGKLGNSGVNLAIVQNNQLLSIEKRSFPETNETIKLFVNNYQHEDYVFKAIPQNLPDGKAVYVQDNYLDTITELDLENGYAFSVDQSVPESTSILRFSILFDLETLGTNNYLSEALNLYPVPVADVLNIANSLDKELSVEVYNTLGQQVVKTKLTNGTSSISMQNLEAGVYIVRISDGDAVFNKQIIKK